MFNDYVTTELSSPTADMVFGMKIKSASYGRDNTFVSTLRALVYPRLGDDDFLNVSFDSSNYNRSVMVDTSIYRCIDAVYVNPDPGSIRIHNFRSRYNDDNVAWIEAVRANLVSIHPQWELLEKVSDFYQKVFNVVCFIDAESKRTLIYVADLDLPKLHYLQCSIPAFLPWYFDPKDGLTELEMELIKSLREKTPARYLECISEFAKQYNFREMAIRDSLRGFEAKVYDAEIQTANSNLRSIRDDIDNYQSQIVDLLSRKSDFEIRLAGLLKKQSEVTDSSELMDYFLCNKSLEVLGVEGQYVSFMVNTYFDYFDEEFAKTCIENDRSAIYSCSRFKKESIRLLMEAIFVKRSVRMRVCAAYKFQLGRNLYALSDDSCEYPDMSRLPNPHIYHYSCLGDYRPVMNEMVMNNDYIGAVEQCCASAKSLNFGDGIVMEKFSYDLQNREGKFIELPDGTTVTVESAIKWLKEQEETNE